MLPKTEIGYYYNHDCTTDTGSTCPRGCSDLLFYRVCVQYNYRSDRDQPTTSNQLFRTRRHALQVGGIWIPANSVTKKKTRIFRIFLTHLEIVFLIFPKAVTMYLSTRENPRSIGNSILEINSGFVERFVKKSAP